MKKAFFKKNILSLKEQIDKELAHRIELGEFKYKKSDSCFFKNEKSVSFLFYIEHEIVLNSDGSGVGIEIKPMFGVRLNEIHKSLERFYQGSNIHDYKIRPTIFIFAEEVIKQENVQDLKENLTFFSSYSQNLLNKKIDYLIMVFNEIGIPFFEEHDTLEKYYLNITKKSLKGELFFAGGGIWIFEQLYSAYKYAKEDFDKYVDFFKKYQSDLALKGEPNALNYVDLFDEIVFAIKNQE